MKPNIHPKFEDIQVTCTSCGNVFTTGSALCAPLSINVCNQCHPFFTGKQKVVDTAGRVKRMQDKFGAFSLKDIGTQPEAQKGKK